MYTFVIKFYCFRSVPGISPLFSGVNVCEAIYHLDVDRTRVKNNKKLTVALLVLSVYFFYLGFMACQDYFTHFEPSQSLGGAKTGDPREKTPDHPQAQLGLSHM